jgi:hypothetical protein
MAAAQNVGSNTLAMVETAVIISASPQVSCLGEPGPGLSHPGFVAVTTLGLVTERTCSWRCPGLSYAEPRRR